MNELMKELMADPVFAVCAAIAVVGALVVVVRRNPVYCALGLMVSFLSFAVILVKLSAPFLAAMHVLVYTGAILVLFLFVIMLLNLSERELGAEHRLRTKALIAAMAAALCGFIVFALVKDGALGGDAKPIVEQTVKAGEQSTPIKAADWGGVEHVGQSLFTFWVFPFELVSVIIMVAILGAVMLAKKKLPPEI